MASTSTKSMPLPKKNGSLYFKGKDVEAFLLIYEACCKDAGLSEDAKCKSIIRYCGYKERELIKSLPAYTTPNTFEDLKIMLMTLYGKADR